MHPSPPPPPPPPVPPLPRPPAPARPAQVPPPPAKKHGLFCRLFKRGGAKSKADPAEGVVGTGTPQGKRHKLRWRLLVPGVDCFAPSGFVDTDPHGGFAKSNPHVYFNRRKTHNAGARLSPSPRCKRPGAKLRMANGSAMLGLELLAEHLCADLFQGRQRGEGEGEQKQEEGDRDRRRDALRRAARAGGNLHRDVADIIVEYQRPQLSAFLLHVGPVPNYNNASGYDVDLMLEYAVQNEEVAKFLVDDRRQRALVRLSVSPTRVVRPGAEERGQPLNVGLLRQWLYEALADQVHCSPAGQTDTPEEAAALLRRQLSVAVCSLPARLFPAPSFTSQATHPRPEPAVWRKPDYRAAPVAWWRGHWWPVEPEGKEQRQLVDRLVRNPVAPPPPAKPQPSPTPVRPPATAVIRPAGVGPPLPPPPPLGRGGALPHTDKGPDKQLPPQGPFERGALLPDDVFVLQEMVFRREAGPSGGALRRRGVARDVLRCPAR